MVFICALGWGGASFAGVVDLNRLPTGPIGTEAHYLQETAGPLTLEAVEAAFASGAGVASVAAVPSFGIGADPVWLRFAVENGAATHLERRLAVQTSWLDRIDAYFVDPRGVRQAYHSGDVYPHGQRPIAARYFYFDHAFPPGAGTVYLRVETPDPMVVPVYLSELTATYARSDREDYLYGFLYGALLALLAYNLLLFVSLRSWRYFYYALYISAFVAMNLAYTGHGYQWLWPQWPEWQRWANHILILLYPIAGLTFATVFLNTRYYFPRLHRALSYSIGAFVAAEALAILLNAHAAALLVSFVLIFLFTLTMVALGVIALRAGNRSAKYFLIASLVHVCGASITVMTTAALVPYTQLGYHAVEIGMILDAVLLAMALANQFRIVQEEKLQAERLAKVDPLTGINNRRAFYEQMRPIWLNAVQRQEPMSVVMLDIDRFKDLNDTYGHAVGDRVLALIATTLMQSTRPADIVARWGGEEFVVLLPKTPAAAAARIAERLRRDIAALSLQGAGVPVGVTASLGVAHSNDSHDSFEELVEVADRHLYEAKRLGRNQVFPALPTEQAVLS